MDRSMPTLNRSSTIIDDDNHHHGRTLSFSEPPVTLPSNGLLNISNSASTGLNLFQSIRDLTQQELHRANPFGLLGKEVIAVTGTTNCPEPIPPRETNGVSSPDTNTIDQQPQQIQFSLNDEEIKEMHNQNHYLTVYPPIPVEYLSDEHVQTFLFSKPSPSTFISDFIPDTMTINVFEVFIYAWGVLAYFFDMFTDIVLAHAYYMEGAYWLFILTLMCVVLPNLTLSIFSLVWYIDRNQLKAAAAAVAAAETRSSSIEQKKISNHVRQRTQLEKNRASKQNSAHDLDEQVESCSSPPASTFANQHAKKPHFPFSNATAHLLTWIIRIIILVLQLDLCLKYIRGLYYTWKGFRKRHQPQWQRFYLTKQILIDADIALLRVFDCFMDSGSQVTLQLYIMLRLGSTAMKFDTLFFKQLLSIMSSLGSLAYSLSGYSRCWRHMQLTHSPDGWPRDKPAPKLVSWWSTIIQWFWYLFLISSRVLALAMFAATFRSWFWIIVAAHWWAMLFWILRFRTIFCISDQTRYNPREAIFEKCYNLVCSYIFIFCYMNLRQGDTRRHYIGFYTIYYIENMIFAIVYAIYSSETNQILKYSLVSFVFIGFWLAILFQIFYYRFLHPNNHVRRNTKKRFSSLVRWNRLKPMKVSEENNVNHHQNSVRPGGHQFMAADETWHNRFSKENRQKLLSQHQVIDQKVKMTRAQRQSERSKKDSNSSKLFDRVLLGLKRTTTVPAMAITRRPLRSSNPIDSLSLDEISNQQMIVVPSEETNFSVNKNHPEIILVASKLVATPS